MATSDDTTLVTVASFPHPVVAWIASNRLADQGIPAFVQDENIVSMYWLYAFAVRGVKVQVRAADAQAASAVLAEVVPSFPPAEADSGDSKSRCPHCGSDEVATDRFSKRGVFLSWLLLGTPLPILGRETRCFSCGHRERPSSWFDNPRPFSFRSLFAWTFIVALAFGMMRAFGITSLSTTGTTTTVNERKQ